MIPGQNEGDTLFIETAMQSKLINMLGNKYPISHLEFTYKINTL